MSIIRKAEKRDVKGAAALLITALDEMKTVFSGYSDEKEILSKLEEYFLLEEGRYTYKNFAVCEIDGNIAGVIVVYYSDEGEKLDRVMLEDLKKRGIIRNSFEKEFYENEFYIDSVAVSPEYQGRGIAKELIKYAENEGREHGYEKMSLIVHGDKEKAYSIYKKIGYEEDSEITVYGENYTHMVKKL
ncbi:GNAT family N-acetyltransferase [Sebaldella sp. S0638]|uniref:GNAT family N-acetyltransferase n=1 Tax=Sebaldella sp. S0638 TaxID=2957809 RepID=UPI00209DE7C0|nr:GNAT family N-acetyltransferase [Sebaldella sp. S0638]MCP1222961.1 GNAT family N-acetyltransferase [Sebaldella sp. S0638]